LTENRRERRKSDLKRGKKAGPFGQDAESLNEALGVEETNRILKKNWEFVSHGSFFC